MQAAEAWSAWPADRIAGGLLCLAAVATVLAMMSHPTGAHGTPGGGGDFVHGAMILLLAALALGFFRFALRRGVDRMLILGGVVAYVISLGAHFGAATINGFVVPALAARGAGAVGHDVFLLAWETNQALARLGVYATGIAFALWSLDFLRRAGPMNWAVGIFGIIAGLVPGAALMTDLATMDIHGALAIYATHAAWAVLVGVQLLRGRV